MEFWFENNDVKLVFFVFLFFSYKNWDNEKQKGLIFSEIKIYLKICIINSLNNCGIIEAWEDLKIVFRKS